MKKDIGFLIDMDGVIYRGGELIPGAKEFIQKLIRENYPFLFLTNNSQRNCRDVVAKLHRMGIDVQEKHIFTCAIATARYLASQKPGGTAYVIGEGGLLTALHQNGYSIVDDEPDYVVIGEGRTIMLESVDKAINMVMNGSKLIATNLDPYCPSSNNSIRSGCGAFVSMIELATGKKAFSAGKPSPVMMRIAKAELETRTANTIMIGDTMETDILGGVQMGFRTVLTLTGSTKRAELPEFAYGPDHIIDSINDLMNPEIFDRIVDGEMVLSQ
ncbi:HAD-IIA family hydrolase [Cyclobacterium sp.]|uniref:HAD-IIA family hydrolase n=1 Tax=Cyclobacterium sp. TaxID=1966343 RepID=UPI0019BD743F|nr:HAD-IIA family hydrolase [Cyclobacterium sp.]MBD3628826.1 HAD family hydrolase [Cyclobacterium sp.]